jgi:hypothetical protein
MLTIELGRRAAVGAGADRLEQLSARLREAEGTF